MKLSTILELAIGYREFATLEPTKNPTDADIMQTLALFPQSDLDAVCVIREQSNGMVRVYRISDWLKSAEHRAEVIADMAKVSTEFDAQHVAKAEKAKKYQAAFDHLKQKFSVEQSYAILNGIEQGEFPALKIKFDL